MKVKQLHKENISRQGFQNSWKISLNVQENKEKKKL